MNIFVITTEINLTPNNFQTSKYSSLKIRMHTEKVDCNQTVFMPFILP